MTSLMIICWFTTLLLLSTAEAANIIGFTPFPGRSHYILVSSLLKELAVRGHNVTIVSSFTDSDPPPNYHQITIDFARLGTEEQKNKMANFYMVDMSIYKRLPMFWMKVPEFVDSILQQDELQKLARGNTSTFDLVIVEAFFSEPFLGFSEVFEAPVVYVCPFGGFHELASSVGVPWPPSYVPDIFLPFTGSMNFLERLQNTALWLFQKLGNRLVYLPRQEEVMQRNLPVKSTMRELLSRTSMVLLNDHVSVQSSRPLAPNFIQVGGMHIKPPKQLQPDLQKFLDSAEEGAIYFSMGSNLRSANFPEEARQSFIEAFGKMKQKVLWKWEEDNLPGQPDNVKIQKWFPQTDILAHPNIKVFISHGGMHSTQEATFHGVPIVGIPIYGDQAVNIRQAVLAGYAMKLDFNNISAESIQWTLNEVISNPSFRKNAKNLSNLFRDRPQSPMDTAIYWTEYVLRHKGAHHLRSAALDLTWYQYLLLDVLATILFCSAFTIIVMFWIVLHLCWSNKGKVGKNKKKD